MTSNQKPKAYLDEDTVLNFLDQRLWERLGKMLFQHPFLLFFAGLGILISEFIPQWLPKILLDIVDGPLKERNTNGILTHVSLFFILVIVGNLLKYLTLLSSQMLALNIVQKIRVTLFENLLSYKIDFFKKTPLGRTMTRLTNDVDTLNAIFSTGIIELISSSMVIVFTIIFMLTIHWKLALVTFLFVPLMLIFTSIFRKKVRDINQLIFKDIAKLNTTLQESFVGIQIVQIFGKIKQNLKLFEGINQSLKKKWLKNITYHSFYFPIMQSITEVSLCLTYFAGIYFFFHNTITLGTLIAFSWYMAIFWRPLKEISEKYTQLQSGLSAAERIFTLLDLDATLPNGTLKTLSGSAELEFKNVYFGYDKESSFLKNICFHIKEGETFAIVGATGSGKSTLIKLCNRLYFPSSGEIHFYGKNILDYDKKTLYSNMAFIPQDIALFSESIAFNICLTHDIDLDRINTIVNQLGIQDFIHKLPQGLNTILNEGSRNISVGERQLIAFARTLYQNPNILFLDEASSSIDTQTEQIIQNALEKITKNMTTIIIAHRLSTIQKADKILVMHKGEIVEAGSHTELLQKNNFYKKLYKFQTLDTRKTI